MMTLTLMGCSEGPAPIFPTSNALDPWVRTQDAIGPGSDQAPRIDGDVVTFHLAQGDRRTYLRAGREWGLVQTYLMGFDVRMDRSPPANQTVTLSRLVRKGDPDTEIVAVKLSARRGITVLGHTCIAPSELGNWHSVELRIDFRDDDSGFLDVFCDRKQLWSQSHMRTTWPPICRHSTGCTNPVAHPVRYEWQTGLIARRGVARETLVEMQRIFYHRLFVIPGRFNAQ